MTGRFTEDEARQIFARAAERQHAVEARGEGLSVEELQAIGREAGLDPEHVAAAVAELRAGPPPVRETVAGADVAPRASRVLPGELTDETWGQVVGRLRRTFGTAGIATEFGRVREWTSGEASNLRVLAEPVEGGTRLTFETRHREPGTVLWLGPGLGGGFSLLFLVLAVVRGKLADPVIWGFILFFAVLAVAGGVWGRRALRRWSETRQGQFDALLDQVELVQRQALGAGAGGDDGGGLEAAPEPPGAARIDPGLLDADPGLEADPEAAAPRRTRS